MPTLTRAAIIQLVEHEYFGSVSRRDIPSVLACFTRDAAVRIYHGDNPTRNFFMTTRRGQTPLAMFYQHLTENFQARFLDFEHFIDLPARRSAATFAVRLRPYRSSPYHPSGSLTLNNCNFFEYRRGRIQRMTIYYANPLLGKKLGLASMGPTGFPKE
jgi:hypothetical protein